MKKLLQNLLISLTLVTSITFTVQASRSIMDSFNKPANEPSTATAFNKPLVNTNAPKKTTVTSGIPTMPQPPTLAGTHISIPAESTHEETGTLTLTPAQAVTMPTFIKEAAVNKPLANKTSAYPAIPADQPIDKHAPETAQAETNEKAQQTIRFFFENASLENLVHYIEDLFKIKFFVDDDISPLPANGAILKGHKITFKTNKALSKKEAWSLFLSFMDIAGLAIVPGTSKDFYRITTPTNANQEYIPTYFDTEINDLPDNTTKVRYVFFVKNSPVATIQTVIQGLASQTARITVMPDLKAIIISDKSSNIKSLMQVVLELDKDLPEAMDIIKLSKSNAEDVANLYNSLVQAEAPQGTSKYMAQRKQPTSLYFPANVRIIPEPRTNSLILLGQRKELDKIITFIKNNVDVDIDLPYSPLHIYNVQYLNAADLAQVLSSVISFGQGSSAAQYGGVRDGNQFFGPMTITPEPAGNRLVIRTSKKDFDKLLPILQELDTIQPQVAIEVLVVDLSLDNQRTIGSQWHNKVAGSPLNGLDFQTSGLPITGGAAGIQTNPTTGSIVTSLITLAQSSYHSPGTTLFTIGNAATGVWGVIKLLQTSSQLNIVSNPFLIATNKYPATVSVGSSRRIVTGTVQGSSSPVSTYGTVQANLTVNITPQITSDNRINMAISVNIQDFSDALNPSDGNTSQKTITTAASVKNRDILVLGGIVRNAMIETVTSVPILGDIPLIGWFFKNKTKSAIRNNLLIFIAPQIISPKMLRTLDEYTDQKFAAAQKEMTAMDSISTRRDPINRAFFEATDATNKQLMNFAQTDPSLNRQAQMRQAKAEETVDAIHRKAYGEKKTYRRSNRKKFINPETSEVA